MNFLSLSSPLFNLREEIFFELIKLRLLRFIQAQLFAHFVQPVFQELFCHVAAVIAESIGSGGEKSAYQQNRQSEYQDLFLHREPPIFTFTLNIRTALCAAFSQL